MDSQNPFDQFTQVGAAPDEPIRSTPTTTSTHFSTAAETLPFPRSASSSQFSQCCGNGSHTNPGPNFNSHLGSHSHQTQHSSHPSQSTRSVFTSDNAEILYRIETLSENVQSLTTAIGSLVTQFQQHSNPAYQVRPAFDPLGDLSSTGLSSYRNTPSPPDDDALSVASQLSHAASLISQSLQDVNPTPATSSGNIAKRLTTLSYDFETNSDILEVKAWYQNVVSHMADEAKFTSLLLPNKRDVDPNPSDSTIASNLNLRTQLWPKLSKPLQRSLQCNDDVVTGTDILLQIRSIFNQEGTNALNAQTAEVQLKSLEWEMNTSSLGQFTNQFTSLLSTVKTGNIPFDHSLTRSTWIKAMPPHSAFTQVKQALWTPNQPLPPPWQTATGPLALQQATSSTLLASGLFLSSFTTTKSGTPKPSNGADKDNHKSRPRLPVPKEFKSIRDYHTHLRKLIKEGCTREDLEKKFKDQFLKDNPGYEGCFVCRIKPLPNSSTPIHKDSDCMLLKKWFTSYSTYPLCSNNIPPMTIHTRKVSAPSNPRTISSSCMCYDSGTTPISMCDDEQYFSTLVYYPEPQEAKLGDEDKTVRILGQGLLDFVIDGKYRVQHHAILSEKCQTALLSAQSHLKFQGCDVTSSNGDLIVIYPSFSFTAKACDRFEFNVTPGKFSSLPISWSPDESQLRPSIALSENVSVVPILSDVTASSGYDVSSSTNITVPPMSTITIPLGFKMAFPSSLHCSLHPRSSLSAQNLHVSLGTIDPDYRGEVKAILQNSTNQPYTITKGQRIGQLVFTPAVHPPLTLAKHLPSTTRGSKGFGSTDSLRYKRVTLPLSTPLAMIPEHGIHEDDSITDQELMPTTRSITTSRPLAATQHQRKKIPSPGFNISEVTVDELDRILYPFRNEVVVEDVTDEGPTVPLHDNAIDMFNLDGDDEDELAHNPEASPTHMHQSDSPPEPPIFFLEHDLDKLLAPSIDPESDNDDLSVSSIDEPLQETQHSPTYAQVADPSYHIPTIPPEDRVSSTEPSTKTITTDFLQKSIGFKVVERVIKKMQDLAQPTIHISNTGCDPVLSRGETATLPKKNRNKKSVPRPQHLGMCGILISFTAMVEP